MLADEAKSAEMMAELERIRKLLRDSDRQAAQACGLLSETVRPLADSGIRPESTEGE